MESAYDRKFKEMKEYIPFLESMIKRLESTSSTSANPRQAQLDKIRSLRDLLLDTKKRMKMENLLKCEQVLVNLYAKVEQRDSFSDIKPSASMEATASKNKTNLDIVRNKLKTVSKIQEDAETLPEIARANDIELHYTGSKEPALFQRRPNTSSSYPARPVQNMSKDEKIKTSQFQTKRYTRVLVSPDRSPRRWSNSEKTTEDKPLFSRRSPHTTQPLPTKKEKKKSKSSKARKTKDLNITLNVPEESLNSLNTKDILSRIITCSDSDVDIDTLRELRSQIIGELTLTGKNDDISDLILKSYKTKAKPTKTKRKAEVEEGELSDSESEAIESIYGSLVVVDKDKQPVTQVKSIENKDNQQRKIQICLVINSDKNESDATDKGSGQPKQIVDLSEFEMFSENESDKSKDIISVDSDTSSSPVKEYKKQVTAKNVQATKKLDLLPPDKIKSPEIKNEVVTVGDRTNIHEKQSLLTSCSEQITNVQSLNDSKNTTQENVSQDGNLLEPTLVNILPAKSLKDSPINNKNDSEIIQNAEKSQDSSVKTPMFIANFYKPIEEQPSTLPVDFGTISNNLSEKDTSNTTDPKDSNDPKEPRKLEDPKDSKDDNSNNCNDPKKIEDPGDKDDNSENPKGTINVAPDIKNVIEKKKEDDLQIIPLLNEPTVPPKAKVDVLSEIDILQALKNEILSDVIAMPGSDTITPALHQPKLTKVASAQEVMPKKRISIENYKQKASASSPKPLFVRKRNNRSYKDRIKNKQSLKLTEKECERFNFPKRLSLDDDDDDIEDISDDDFLSDDKEDTFGLDDIYGDLAPRSPDNELSSESSVPPVIIPIDPIKASVVSSRIDVDMRALMPIVSSLPKPGLLPLPTPVPPPLGYGVAIPPSPVYGIDRSRNEANIEQSKNAIEKNKLIAMDPRIRRDLSSTSINSPNPYGATNPDRTPRSLPYSNAVPSGPGMTPSRTPVMTPSRTPIMTPSYAPSIPPLMALNPMPFDMTPSSHQSFDLDDSATRKHVYAPSFSMCDNRESVSKDGPHWEDSFASRNESRGAHRIRWDDSSTSTGPKWEDREPKNTSGLADNSRYESYKPKYDKYNNRLRSDCYNVERRDSYSKSDCPTTPIPSFGWSECPPTPGSTYGRQDAPMTPSHPFSRSDCPTTPSHSFGRGDCPSTPASAFGRSEPLIHSFGGQPSTPSHSFGRSDCPSTPVHSFGRNDCPQTPSHSFGRPDISNNSNNQKYAKDPRINRRQTDYDSSSCSERDRDYQYERNNTRRNSSYKSQSNHYSGSDASGNYEGDRSINRNEKKCSDERDIRQYDRDRREVSLSRSLKETERERLYTRNRESRYDGKSSRYYDDRSKRDRRETSTGRTLETNNQSRAVRARSTSRARSVGRNADKEPNKDHISLKSYTDKDLTINTSINTTFQEFVGSGKPIQVFDYALDVKRQRAVSVGRSLIRESSVGRASHPTLKTNKTSICSINMNNKFKRASSVGRELVNTEDEKSFQEVKADLELYRSKLDSKKVETTVDTSKSKIQANPLGKKDVPGIKQQDRKSSYNKQPYSPRKNNRDPRMRQEYPVEHKSRYKIDRRGDLRDGKRSGIIYSSDNIAKGTIMGSGFGVKNYKIPKIKRVTVETPEENSKEKPEQVEKKKEVNKNKDIKKVNESDKKIVPKDTKEIIKAVDDCVQNIKNKNEIEIENKKVINKFLVDDTEKRVTRSKKKTDAISQDDDSQIIRTRKCKKSVIYDSESDSETEKEEVKKVVKESDNKPKSPSKKMSNSKKESPVKEKEVQNKSNEVVLDSNFGIDDMEIFSENIGTDPVMENINALIADLDNDLDSSKISSFTSEIENMMETINSPESNSLGDISEVIEKDLNESNEKLQQKLFADNLLQENQSISTQKTLPEIKPVASQDTDYESLSDVGEVMKISKDTVIAKLANMETPLNGSQITVNTLAKEDTSVSKVNEEIVSTTDIDQSLRNKEHGVEKSTIEITTRNEDQSVPDSTINKNPIDKAEDGLPDSTIEMHCELSSDVTSTYDAAETSKKESEIQNSTQKDTLTSIGSLLSILQDKSKIKELLSMLGEGDQSSDHDKIKKKLEKLSEIVSDEEDVKEDHKKEEDVKDGLPDSKIDEIFTQKIEPILETQKKEKETKHDDLLQKNDGISEKRNVQDNEKVDIEKSEKDIQIEKCEDKIQTQNKEIHENIQSSVEVVKGTNEISPADNSNKTVPDCITPLENKEKIFDTINKDEADELEDEEQDDEDIDETSIKGKKKVTKKTKSKKFCGKSKPINKNKPLARAIPNLKKNLTKAVTKDPIKKTTIRKKPSELQKLQDDIKEMFMKEDILNTTGIRMCRLAKMVNEKDDLQESEPVVVLEKVKGAQNTDQLSKLRKKPRPKPKHKAMQAQKSSDSEKILDKRTKSSEKDIKMDKPKAVPKYKPGPKSKKRTSDELDPYEFDTDSVADTNTTRESDSDSSNSENESLASSRSFGSSEVLAETKKKPKKKRRGTRGWQSGIIKPKNRKKKEQKQDTLIDEPAVVKPQKPITIPDMNCFTDKTYCFQKGVTTYDCRLCVYSGTDIINHYKKQHPHTEIPLSRMDSKAAESAIVQCEEQNFPAIIKVPSDKYTCRFCGKEFGSNRVALETFFWHIVSSHTGEFKHLCSECVNVTRCPFTLDIPPPPKSQGQLIGYICGKCHYTQISIENLKMHVIVRHNDEETEVYAINLAIMSNKALKAILRRIMTKQPRVLRSSRSNPSAASTSDYRDDHSDDHSDATGSSGCNSELDSTQLGTDDQKEVDQKPNPDQMKAKLTFENDEPSDDMSVKLEEEEHEADDRDDRDETAHFDATFNIEPADAIPEIVPPRGNPDDIVDYPHFKRSYTDSGAKEYVCCINGNDNHYKTSLLISMKKHVQLKHSEKWDGYCCLCKVIVTLQGVQSNFKDCLSHFLDKHLDEFPILEKVVGTLREKSQSVEDLPRADPVLPPAIQALTSPLPALSPAIPARVATPPVERTASPSYIAVRPLAELISKELVKEVASTDQVSITFPKIENIVSLGETVVPPSQPSPVYPTTVEPAATQEKPFLYEDVQAEVMSKKHRVVLDSMMTKEVLVRVFKCAGRFCSFTSDSPDDALLHASTHQRVGGEGALNCAYCNYDACENGIDLVMHVFKEHSRCQYCCPLCFYRAAASQLVGAHYAKAHAEAIKLKNALRSTGAAAPSTPANPDSVLLSRDVAVQHFVCNHDDGACNFRTYTPGKFIEHLVQKHGNVSSHSCNLCPSSFPTPSDLVVHQRTHGLRLYQCTWCVYGANTELQLLAHAASRHYDRQPQAYVRVITSKDGSSTLRVLPLAYLNKSKVPVEDVAPNTTKENPVREAERSIELEKLIGHTLLMMEASSSLSLPPAEEPTPMEEPVELSPEVLPESLTENEPLTSDSSPETQELVAEKSNTPEAIHEESHIVKSEPTDAQKETSQVDVICLDSDEEAETSKTIPEESPVNERDNDNDSNLTAEATIRRVSSEVSRSSVTNEVSITKITDESIRKDTSVDDSRLNVIDLSDDDPAPVSEPGNEPIIKPSEIFKCPFCFTACKSANGLRKHLKGCIKAFGNITSMPCPHKPCSAVVSGQARLIEHYSKVHRDINIKHTMSNYCGICRNPFPTQSGAKMHIRAVHKVQHYQVSTTLSPTGERIRTLWAAGAAIPPAQPRISARKTSTEIQRYGITDRPEPPPRARKASMEVKKRYGIDDIDKLPISPILDCQVYCDSCEFGTKVRLNMVRHLQQHAGSLPVPHTAPVNPVPHLETNEMHFDRMVNLASSSIVSRATDKPPRPEKPRPDAEPAVSLMVSAGESSRYPKYVPERQRYTCGAKGCSYISVDMAMFRCHWETLHARDEEYRCVHCPPHQALDTSIPLTAARILAHLRMHDVGLYACSVCSYYHYRKHLVEKHLAETHKDASVKVVREEGAPVAATPPPAVGAPTMDLKAWQCGLCKFSSMLRPEVVNHCALKHQSKMQFKCSYCPFRTSALENVTKHQTNAHPAKAEEVFYYFYREGSVPDENGVPRWQQQRQRAGLDEPDVKTEPQPSGSVHEQATLTPVVARPQVDLNIVKKEVAEEHAPSDLSMEDLYEKFGQFCEPDGIKYKCCLCNVVREHTKEAMQCHLYEELNYRRWECAMCSYKAFHKNGLNDHMASEHSRQFTPPKELPVDTNIEKWVQKLLDHQASTIETNIQNLAIQKIQVERVVSAPASPRKVESPKPTSSTPDAELEAAFGDFGAPKNHQYSCPKCEFVTKDEGDMVYHLESELTKIRWGCTNCTGKYQTFHEAQFHCKSIHTGQPARPREAVRDPSIRSGWINAVVTSQKQFMKCISETGREPTPEENTEDSNENSLLVAMYDEPVHMEEHLAISGKRPAPALDSDEERLVIDEPLKKKPNCRECPYCDYTSVYPRCVKEHIMRHYNIKPYQCGHCSFDGVRQTVLNHMDKIHPGKSRYVKSVPIPNHLPTDIALKPPKRDVKESDDVLKKVCLYCEKSVLETEVESHVHANEPPEFAKRGDVVVKCSYCFVLRLNVTSLQEHITASHPGERMNYAYFKLLVDTREIYCCGHCHKKFKFLRDLKAHHTASHITQSMSYTSIPFSLNLHTEGDIDTSKRKLDDTAGLSVKRVARKSTSKLPNSAVAKKSTTKLPFTQPNLKEYSVYGTKPLQFDNYENVTLLMPMYNTMVEIDVKKLSGILNINPKVVVKDCKR